MSNASIRVNSASEYVIEVNDKGDTISLDMADTGLATRLFTMYEKIDELTKEYEGKAKELDARPDEQINEFMTKNQVDGMNMINQFYIESRSAVDLFLGEGACQKIFGSKNYHSMFNDLLEQLEPHFKKMNLDYEAIKKKTIAKYAPNREQRRALK